MCAPEHVFVGCRFRLHRGAPRELAAGNRSLSKHVSDPVAESVAKPRHLLVCGSTVRTGVAAVLDEGQVGAVGAEDVVVLLVDRPVEPVQE